MAKTVLGLDLSGRSWKAVAVTKAGRGERLHLNAYATLSPLPFPMKDFLGVNPETAPGEESLRQWADELNQTLAPLLQDAKSVIIGLPEELVSLRVLDLPFSQADKIARVLPFEAENTMLFDAEDLVFDFFPLSQQNGKTRVLAAAVKREHLLLLLERLKLVAIDPAAVTPTFLSFHHLLGVLGESAEPERIAFLFLGEDKARLSVAEEKRTIFAQSFPLGQDLAPAGEELPMISPAALETILNHLDRSLHYLEGFTPLSSACPPPLKKIVLVGDGAQLPGLAAQISERLSIPVMSFTMPESALADETPLSADLQSRLAPALALTLPLALPNGRPALNFRKGEFAYQPERREFIRKMIVPAILAALLILSLGGRAMLAGSPDKKQAAALRAEMASAFKANFPQAPVMDPAVQIQKLLEEAKAKQQKYQELSTPPALDCLAAVSQNIPDSISVKLSSFDYKGTEVSFAGSAQNYENPNQIAKLLQQNVPVFYKVVVENATKVSETEIRFKVNISLKKEKEAGP